MGWVEADYINEQRFNQWKDRKNKNKDENNREKENETKRLNGSKT
jgi:hypothetical protein